MKKLIGFLTLFVIATHIFAHPWKPRHYVIVDTDGGVDDMKALCMLLASPDVRLLAVTVSPGALTADQAYIKVRSLLDSFRHEGIPVGINREAKYRSPSFEMALKNNWGTENGINPSLAPDAALLVNRILNSEKTKVSFIALGSLSTASLCNGNIDVFSKQVKEIVWSGNPTVKTGFNYTADISAAEKVFAGQIPVKSFTPDDESVFYTRALIEKLGKSTGRYVLKIAASLKSSEKDHAYSFTVNDELVAFLLHYPGLFSETREGKSAVFTPKDIEALRLRTDSILNGETVEKNQVIRRFPKEPGFYFPDIKPFVTEIITLHGEDEWVSGVIASELHRHLGVFAIIGVKMGIRAREYFNTGVDEFKVVSSAGSMPPLSCMNDGIQVSTGATPGHGLLTVRNDNTQPSAEFTYLGTSIRITLKPEIASVIAQELKEINFIHGLDSDIYWELVRKNTIKYWRTLDRHDIFTIERLN